VERFKEFEVQNRFLVSWVIERKKKRVYCRSPSEKGAQKVRKLLEGEFDHGSKGVLSYSSTHEFAEPYYTEEGRRLKLRHDC